MIWDKMIFYEHFKKEGMISLPTFYNQSMLRFYLCIFLIWLSISPLSACAQKEEDSLTYIAFGDSITEGLLENRSISHTNGYFGYITKWLQTNGYEVNAFNYAKAGSTSTDVQKQLDHLAKHPNGADIITISVGANDFIPHLKAIQNAVFKEKIATARYTLRQYEASTISLEEVFTNTESAFEQLTPELLALQTFLNDLIVTLENDESFQNLSDAQAKMEAYKEHATTIENMIKTTQQITTDFSKEKKEQHEGESLLTSESDTSRQITSAIADIAAMKQSIATAFESTQHTELLPELQETYQSSLDEASRKLKNSYEALIHTQTQLVELDEALQYAGQLFEKQPTALSTLQTGKETIDKSFSDAQGEVDTIAKNIDTILNDVKKANPNVDVYILGYYNTFPYLSEALQTKTDALLISLNDTIEETAKANDVTYVPSFEAFDGHYEEFLPNVKDIHPSQAGYRTLAKQFITEIKEAYPPISKKKR